MKCGRCLIRFPDASRIEIRHDSCRANLFICIWESEETGAGCKRRSLARARAVIEQNSNKVEHKVHALHDT